MQTLRKAEPVEHQHDQPAADDADEAAEDRLLGERRGHVLPRPLAQHQELDQHQREKHREWIVAAGLHLEGGADARAKA